MQQPVGARQAAINLKLLLQYALRIDRTKRHHPDGLNRSFNVQVIASHCDEPHPNFDRMT